MASRRVLGPVSFARRRLLVVLGEGDEPSPVLLGALLDPFVYPVEDLFVARRSFREIH